MRKYNINNIGLPHEQTHDLQIAPVSDLSFDAKKTFNESVL